ncbi:MAG: hypothetical protein A3F10_00080 [Coxiella sp. RIFCSPHIGHO2_12_FULL_42_15]|nr:MAG: hypothetical protein A3F10_00080 [Coxiella sp. RIFCSPHIGHO2_12_FULL_42_15]
MRRQPTFIELLQQTEPYVRQRGSVITRPEQEPPRQWRKLLQNLVSAAHHSADTLRIGTVNTTLLSRWLYEFFQVSQQLNAAPSSEIKMTWLGFPITASSFVIAVLLKIANHLKKAQDPAYEDYFFAVLSSALFYNLLDNFDQQEKITVGSFIATSLTVPVVSFISSKLTIPDSTYRLTLGFSDVNFPHYPDATRSEKMLNLLLGFSYGAAPNTLLWVINRELNGETVPLHDWQYAITAAYFLITSIASYKMTDCPEFFHVLVALSKAMRDGALSYSALSGIAFYALMYQYDCKDQPCWNEVVNQHLSFLLPGIAAGVALYSGAHTHFRYDKNHESNLHLIDLCTQVKTKLSSCLTSLFCRTNTVPEDNELENALMLQL